MPSLNNRTSKLQYDAGLGGPGERSGPKFPEVRVGVPLPSEHPQQACDLRRPFGIAETTFSAWKKEHEHPDIQRQ